MKQYIFTHNGILACVIFIILQIGVLIGIGIAFLAACHGTKKPGSVPAAGPGRRKIVPSQDDSRDKTIKRVIKFLQ